MSEFNPYTPPASDPLPQADHGDPPLASRGSRLAAAVWDLFIVVVLMLIVLMVFGALTRPQSSSWQVKAEGAPGLPLYYAIWLPANWSSLKRGQTLGKRLLRIKTVRSDGSPLDPARYLSHRTLPILLLMFFMSMNLPPAISWLGLLVLFSNVNYIFFSDRRCLHDLIADTKVVKAG